jgi:prepilin-type N-terminal cleavage/methylation domain-containing protein
MAQTGPGAVPRPRAFFSAAGATLSELLVVIAILGLGAAWAAPAVAGHWRRAALRGAAFDLAGQIRRLRHEAAAQTRMQALAFDRRNGRWTVRRYADGNRNGVRAAEMASGVDPALAPAVDLGARWSVVAPGLAEVPIPRIPPARGALMPGSDPLQLSGTDRISCSPGGGCTGGTIYLKAGPDQLAAVVVYGGTGRVRVWRFVPRDVRWNLY